MAENAKEKCIDDCLDCYRMCEKTLSECLGHGGKHAERGHILLMMDCARACRETADFMLRNSAYQSRICAICASICDDCGKSCDSFEEKFMKECAETCKRCSESCQTMGETGKREA